MTALAVGLVALAVPCALAWYVGAPMVARLDRSRIEDAEDRLVYAGVAAIFIMPTLLFAYGAGLYILARIGGGG